MSTIVHARVVEHLQRLRLGFVAERLDAVLNEAAKREPTYDVLWTVQQISGEDQAANFRRTTDGGLLP